MSVNKSHFPEVKHYLQHGLYYNIYINHDCVFSFPLLENNSFHYVKIIMRLSLVSPVRVAINEGKGYHAAGVWP